jgi:hypothetical protein
VKAAGVSCKVIAAILDPASGTTRDYRAALTAVRELTRLAELSARLMGELRDREINLGFINIDPETMERMAQMFLARRGTCAPTIATGTEPVTVVQVIENEPAE